MVEDGVSAIKLEDCYRSELLKNREADKISFRTNFGIHRSDFTAIFLEKNIEF